MLTEKQIKKLREQIKKRSLPIDVFDKFRALLADREELKALLARALEALKKAERDITNWSQAGVPYHSCCGKVRDAGHHPDCLVGNAIEEIEEAVK